MNNIVNSLKNILILALATGLFVAMPFRSYAPPPLCTNTVQNNFDGGPGSLREALAKAHDGDTITFCPIVTGAITLTNGPLFISNSVTILGPGSGALAINGNRGVQFGPIFYVNSNHIVTIASLSITNGTVGGLFGGGIYNDHSFLTVSNCVLSGNSAAGGGAIYNDGANFGSATLTIVASTITNNLAMESGGGVYNDAFLGNAALTILGSTFSQNSSSEGGAIYSRGALTNMTLKVYNSTLSSNVASFGGGGLSLEGPGLPPPDDDMVFPNTATILNSTLDGNSAGPAGGDSIRNNGSAVAIASTILNVRSSGTNISNTGMGAVASLGFNLCSDGGSGFLTFFGDQTNTAPLLGPLQENGGPTFTHAPLCGSPAIDKGRNLSGASTDQRGAARRIDLAEFTNALLGDGTDVGAVESPIWTFTVQNTNDSGAGSLRQAVLDANANGGIDVIEFAPGSYGTVTLINGELLISDCLFINGPGATNAIVNANHASRVFHVSSNNIVRISGLTLTNGATQLGTFPDNSGGGILNDSSILTVTGCAFMGNEAGIGGGGIANVGQSGSNATLTVDGCFFYNNSAGKDGGGVLNESLDGASSAIVMNSIISSNHANFGGGLYSLGFGGGLLVTNTLISSNSAAGGGGGIVCGGLIPATVINSTISGNSSGLNGGAIYTITGDTNEVVVINTTLSGNFASNSGGAVFTEAQSPSKAILSIYNSTLSGNAAPQGSGIVVAGSDGEIQATMTLKIGSTILDAPSPGIISNSFGSILSLGYNLSSDDGGGFLNQSTDQTNSNPMLGPLQKNGGLTLTHALLCGSPAIDTGTNFLALATDQRGTGYPRKFGPATDIGAFELEQVCNQPPVALCTNVMVSADSNCLAHASIDQGSYDPDVGDSITNSVQSPAGPYSLGTNLVTLTVTDTHGETNSCQAMVIVVDTTPPVIDCPTSIVTTNDPGQSSGTVSFDAKATDNCEMLSITSDPASGSSFPVGTNIVTVTAVDKAGNTNTCTFTVTILEKEAPQVSCRPAPNPSGKISPPGKGSTVNPNGYYQVLAKDNSDPNPSIYIKDTGSPFVAGPFKDGDIVRLKHAGGAPSSVPGTAPIVAVISLKGNGLVVATDASGNTTPIANGCVMAVSGK